MILLSIVQDMILVMLVLLRIQGGDNYSGGDAECSDNGNDGNYAGDDGDIDDNGDVGGETNVGVCCKNEPETDKDDVKEDIDNDDIDGGDVVLMMLLMVKLIIMMAVDIIVWEMLLIVMMVGLKVI